MPHEQLRQRSWLTRAQRYAQNKYHCSAPAEQAKRFVMEKPTLSSETLWRPHFQQQTHPAGHCTVCVSAQPALFLRHELHMR
jgi:hypothetical protein